MSFIKASTQALMPLKCEMEETKMKKLFMLQFFASWEDISTNHATDLEGSNLGESVKTLTEKLGTLGYDVLFNNRKSAEFVPSARLHETTGQRDQFKLQVETQTKELLAMQTAAKGNEGLQAQIQTLMNANDSLLKDMEKTRIDAEIMVGASDAHNPKSVIPFINFDNIKVDSKGNVMGVDTEMLRLKTEMPYLFQSAEELKKRKGGSDPIDDKGNPKLSGMNAVIRQAAGRVR